MKNSKPSIKPSRPTEWPTAAEGFRIVGGGRKVPGHASENAAKIEISKNPQWKLENATIIPFSWNDGGCAGCSAYWQTTTRYVIVIIDTRTKSEKEWWKAA